MAGQLDCDLGPCGSRASNQPAAVLQLAAVAVSAGVKLDEGGVEPGCEGRNPGMVVGACCHDHSRGRHQVVAADHVEMASRCREPLDFDAGSDGQLELALISL